MPEFRLETSTPHSSIPDFRLNTSTPQSSIPNFQLKTSTPQSSIPNFQLKTSTPQSSIINLRLETSTQNTNSPDFRWESSTPQSRASDFRIISSTPQSSTTDFRRDSSMPQSLPCKPTPPPKPNLKMRTKPILQPKPNLDLVKERLVKHAETSRQTDESDKRSAVKMEVHHQDFTHRIHLKNTGNFCSKIGETFENTTLPISNAPPSLPSTLPPTALALPQPLTDSTPPPSSLPCIVEGEQKKFHISRIPVRKQSRRKDSGISLTDISELGEQFQGTQEFEETNKKDIGVGLVSPTFLERRKETKIQNDSSVGGRIDSSVGGKYYSGLGGRNNSGVGGRKDSGVCMISPPPSPDELPNLQLDPPKYVTKISTSESPSSLKWSSGCRVSTTPSRRFSYQFNPEPRNTEPRASKTRCHSVSDLSSAFWSIPDISSGRSTPSNGHRSRIPVRVGDRASSRCSTPGGEVGRRCSTPGGEVGRRCSTPGGEVGRRCSTPGGEREEHRRRSLRSSSSLEVPGLSI